MEFAIWLVALGVTLVIVTPVAGGGVFAWHSAWKISRRNRLIEDDWAAFAEGLGLHHSGRSGSARIFRGLAGKRRMKLEALEHDSGTDWVVRLATWRRLPHRNDYPHRGRVTDDEIEFTLRKVDRRDMPKRIEELLGVLASLEESEDQAWRAAGERYGLAAEARHGKLLPALSGEGVRVVQREDDLGRFLEVRARWNNPSLGALEIARKGILDVEVEADNPVLAMLVSVMSDKPDEVRRLLAREDVTEAVLEVVHGFPGSRVLPGWVVLQARMEPVGVDELLQKALRLRDLLGA